MQGIFFKEGISTKQQVEINMKISDMVNTKNEDAVIIYHLFDHWNFTLGEARKELKKAKLWMGWYANRIGWDKK